MAKATKDLTAKRVERLKTPGRYHDPEHRGLYLQIGPTGTKSWLLRYEHGGRERWHGLGSVKDFSLKEARERARAKRQLLADGLDPIEVKISTMDQAAKEARERLTFKQATDEFLNLHADGWKNAKHRAQWKSTLTEHAFPKLGERAVASIDAAMINEAVMPIWLKTPETARRVKQRIERVVQWVKDGKPLPGAGKNGEEHFPSLPWSQIPEFMTELRKHESVSAKALEFTVLTAARTAQTTGAKRSEFDLDAKLWTIPAERMKAAREHRVALSDRVIEILRSLPGEDGNNFVFIGGEKGMGLSNAAMSELLKGMHAARKRLGLPAWVDAKSGRLVVPHGFRSSFRTWGAEATHYPETVVKAALAHSSGDKVEKAYQRGDMLTKRFNLMRDWARYCASKPTEIADLAEKRKAKARA